MCEDFAADASIDVMGVIAQNRLACRQLITAVPT